jgi:hypothetical protein
MQWFDEGKLNLVKSVLASQRLLEAELSLSSKRNDQVTAISAHLDRAHYLIDVDRKEPRWCRDNRDIWIAEAEATLDEWRARLKTMHVLR